MNIVFFFSFYNKTGSVVLIKQKISLLSPKMKKHEVMNNVSGLSDVLFPKFALLTYGIKEETTADRKVVGVTGVIV